MQLNKCLLMFTWVWMKSLEVDLHFVSIELTRKCLRFSIF